jgi:Family of unknown function (DUF6064)
MKLPFTPEQFLQVFKDYNLSVWPIQVFIYILAIVAILASLYKLRGSGKIIFTILGFFWIWMGLVYHIIFFSGINKAATFFGAAFIAEGLLFLYTGFFNKHYHFAVRNTINGITGSFLVLFSLIIYPVSGYFLGHVYPYSPTFGLPCPTTIFTLGILLWSDKKIPLFLLLIPFAWSIIGFSAAFSLGIKEDTGLIIASLLFLLLSRLKDKAAHSPVAGTS